MIFLSKKVGFCAAHRLVSQRLSQEENQRTFGKGCRSLHGHNYELKVTLAGQPDAVTGMLFNLEELNAVLEDRIVGWLDHRELNALPEFSKVVPTSENIARTIWRRLDTGVFAPARLYEIELWETKNSSVLYRGESEES
jgi:6-pyruvoyltetrahydropterin/6-carboxytetrahydropterin synthase